MTNYLRRFALVAVIGLISHSAGIAQVPESRKTTLTIDAPIQLPTTTLQPGSYVVKLLNDDANRHVVQFFDKGEQHLITTILAIPNRRLKPTGKSVFTFWEVPAGQPKALRAWFYPGDDFGQEFAYPKEQAAQISANNNSENVPISDDKDLKASAAVEPAADTTAAAAAPIPAPAPVEVAAAAPPEPAAAVDQPAPPAPVSVESHSDAQQVSTPQTLPQTASNLPWFALIGVLAMVAALALNVVYRRA
jgi:LPXTG-motif cell wall-anchored protein